MTIFKALILSVVEGLTEFLPISSTAHLMLTSRVFNVAQTDFVKSFEIFIQLGAVVAVAVVYFEYLFKNKKLWKQLLISLSPTLLLGFVFYPFIKSYLIGNITISLIALFAGGIVLILIDKLTPQKHQKISSLTNTQALMIGFFQSISIIPGTSRAAATIVGGLFAGLTKRESVKYSFLLAIPTMITAASLDIFLSSGELVFNQVILLIVGFIISFITALLAIRLFISQINKHTLQVFGWYRIILVVLFLLIFR